MIIQKHIRYLYFDLSPIALCWNEWLITSSSDALRILGLQQEPITQLDLASKEFLRRMDDRFVRIEQQLNAGTVAINAKIDQSRDLMISHQAMTHKALLDHDQQQKRQRLLDSLMYPHIYQRIGSITARSKGTYDWIFDVGNITPTQSFA